MLAIKSSYFIAMTIYECVKAEPEMAQIVEIYSSGIKIRLNSSKCLENCYKSQLI